MSTPIISIQNVNAFYGDKHIVKNVSFDVMTNQVVAIIGPSGCGKSTLLRCINRMHEEDATAGVEGSILLNGENIFENNVDPVVVRQKVGMVFQKPTAFQGLSVWENVIAGRLLKGEKKSGLKELAEIALKQASLWDEVKDKLNAPGVSLSGGQQQRLCIARALAVNPTAILMDEPTSALDPVSAARIEELIAELKKLVTIIIVTHNLHQAARVSDHTAFMNFGELVEFNATSQLFTMPSHKLTEAYITGQFS
ncbi:MAG: phosphate ABC transporter ATP-binding protein PstB [Pseudobdellovibrio sp.]